MKNGRTWTATIASALMVALAVVLGAGCGKADERALKKGLEAAARGQWQTAKQCYARAAELDNAEGARRLAELLVKGEGASLFGASRKRDAAWIAEAEALTARIGNLLHTAQTKGVKVDDLEGTLNSYTAAIHWAKAAEEGRQKAEEESRRKAEEEAEAARIKAEEEARLKAEEEVKSARRKAEAEAKRRAEEAAAAKAVSEVFAKARQAEGEGAINFFGFYTGMLESDARVLAKHYGLGDGEWWCKSSNKSLASRVASVHFSLAGLRRVTKGGNSFEELAQAVANRVGTLTCERERYAVSSGDRTQDLMDMLGGTTETRVGEYYKYNTIDGIYVVVAEKAMGEIPSGFLMWDDKLLK